MRPFVFVLALAVAALPASAQGYLTKDESHDQVIRGTISDVKEYGKSRTET
ncbi:MAG: hypothetical protein GDA49_11975 [Rhodospirillales bacterium]|nr:hypothetical protein [Rhodospirillales bacterium]